ARRAIGYGGELIGKAGKATLLDLLLSGGWFASREEALPWIMAGKVLVGGEKALGGGQRFPVDSAVRVRGYYKRSYAGKGGIKLKTALLGLGVDVADKACLDCGSSVGGFVDCLLSEGASTVYAVDAGKGELAAKLRHDGRVVCLEGTNIAAESLRFLDPKPEVITLDLTYLSLRKAVPICWGIAAEGATVVALVKPIYEMGAADAARKGSMEDKGVLVGVMEGLLRFFADGGIEVTGVTNSPVRGGGGAPELFMALRLARRGPLPVDAAMRAMALGSVGRALALGRFDKDGLSG
ncbi:MAG: hypothetical protein FWE70_00280, partial [Oscillospiraceae bacterium]|nr:hypothetical protein [Oscillospiraceae bacterium]